MTQSSYPLDAQNFLSPHEGVLAVSLICNTALEGLKSNPLNDIKLEFEKIRAIGILQQLRLACQQLQDEHGFVAMK